MQIKDVDYKQMVEALDDLGNTVEKFKEHTDQHNAKLKDELKSENAALRERIELIEADEATGYTRKLDRQEPQYTVLHSGGQPAYVVRSTGRLSDIPALQRKTDVSLDRWLGALALGDACEDKEAIAFAHEMKTVTTGTSGALVPEAFQSVWIDMARGQSVLNRAGMVTVTMPEKTLTWSHQTGDPTFSWRSSEGGSLSATDPSFATRTLTAKTVAVRTQVSLEASQDIPQFGQQLTRAYAAAFGAAIDMAGIQGAGGSPQVIHGLQTTSGVGTVTSVGVPTNWDEIVDGAAVFLNANNPLENLTGIIMHPDVWKVYAKLKTGISSDNTPLELPPAIANVPQFVSTNADTVESPQNYHIEMGNFNDLVMGVRMQPTIRILDGTTSMASNLLVEIIGVARIDFLVTRPASFVVLSGVATG